MFPLTDDLRAALVDDAALLGHFISIGVVESGVILWRHFNSSGRPATLDGVTYPAPRRILEVRMPGRRTVNLGGGRAGSVRVVDGERSLHSLLEGRSIDDTRVRWHIALFRADAWTEPLRVMTGFVARSEWEAETGSCRVELVSRLLKERSKTLFATDNDQRSRNPADGSLIRVGEQLYSDWSG